MCTRTHTEHTRPHKPHSAHEELNPKGMAVVLEASHMCMTMRGVKKPGATMVTTQLLGRFKTDEKTRAEFMSRIYAPR